MKLATLRNGRPDGQLVVISADMKSFVSAARIAPSLQAALDDWPRVLDALRRLSDDLRTGAIAGQPFDVSSALAPLPRAYRFIDGAGYLGHLERVRALKGESGPVLSETDPLLQQGASDAFAAPADPIRALSEDVGVDFEAEIAVIVGPVPAGADKKTAASAIRLVALCNDVTFRRLVGDDLRNGFGFFHSKPGAAFAPVVSTPDELGVAWRDNRLSARVRVHVNDTLFGQPDAGRDMHFDFADLVMAAASTRALSAGTVIGSGTIANSHDEVLPIKRDGTGFASIAEARTAERAKFDKPRTPFLKGGDRVRIAAYDELERSLFGAIEQTVSIGGGK